MTPEVNTQLATINALLQEIVTAISGTEPQEA